MRSRLRENSGESVPPDSRSRAGEAEGYVALVMTAAVFGAWFSPLPRPLNVGVLLMALSAGLVFALGAMRRGRGAGRVAGAASFAVLVWAIAWFFRLVFGGVR